MDENVNLDKWTVVRLDRSAHAQYLTNAWLRLRLERDQQRPCRCRGPKDTKIANQISAMVFELVGRQLKYSSHSCDCSSVSISSSLRKW